MTESQGRDDYLPQSLLKLAGLVTEFGERRQIPAQRVIDLHQILVSLPGLDAAADEHISTTSYGMLEARRENLLGELETINDILDVDETPEPATEKPTPPSVDAEELKDALLGGDPSTTSSRGERSPIPGREVYRSKELF